MKKAISTLIFSALILGTIAPNAGGLDKNNGEAIEVATMECKLPLNEKDVAEDEAIIKEKIEEPKKEEITEETGEQLIVCYPMEITAETDAIEEIDPTITLEAPLDVAEPVYNDENDGLCDVIESVDTEVVLETTADTSAPISNADLSFEIFDQAPFHHVLFKSSEGLINALEKNMLENSPIDISQSKIFMPIIKNDIYELKTIYLSEYLCIYKYLPSPEKEKEGHNSFTVTLYGGVSSFSELTERLKSEGYNIASIYESEQLIITKLGNESFAHFLRNGQYMFMSIGYNNHTLRYPTDDEVINLINDVDFVDYKN